MGVSIARTGGVVSSPGVTTLLTKTAIGETSVEFPPKSVIVMEMTCSSSSAANSVFQSWV